MSTTNATAPRFRVGDWVSLLYGPRRAMARVIEDRGRLGINGRRLYRIHLNRTSEDSTAFEVPEDDLEAAIVPDRAAVVRFLKGGGLSAILRSNLAGGRAQPRVWLTTDPRGEVSYTYFAREGLIGGATVPFLALHDGKIFTAKRDEVMDFLHDLGLSRPEAEDVIGTIGTAP